MSPVTAGSTPALDTTSAEIPLDYRRCGCQGVMPGRACRHCGSTRWQRRCPDCLGIGLLYKSVRRGCPGQNDRSERCGRCMGIGWTPTPMAEISEAERQEALALGVELAQVPAPAPVATVPAVVEVVARQEARRAAIKRSKAKPKRKVGRGRARVSIAAERVQNPLEAMELAREEDFPQALATEAETEDTDLIVEPPAREQAPGSFAPDMTE